VTIQDINRVYEAYPRKLREWEAFKVLIRQEIVKKNIGPHHEIQLLLGKKLLSLPPAILGSPNAAAWIYQFCHEKDPDTDIYGRYYTCDWLADFLAEISGVNRFSSTIRLFEPTCGCGNLINGILSRLNHSTAAVYCDACDIDNKALTIARTILTLNHKNKLPRLILNLQKRNFIYLEAKPVYDLIVLSPPFVDINRLKNDEKKRIREYNGEINNTAEYFIMRSFDHARDRSGTVLFVCPANLLKKNSLLYSFLETRGSQHVLYHLPIPGDRDVVVGKVNKNQTNLKPGGIV
jgi:hypothetical protein